MQTLFIMTLRGQVLHFDWSRQPQYPDFAPTARWLYVLFVVSLRDKMPWLLGTAIRSLTVISLYTSIINSWRAVFNTRRCKKLYFRIHRNLL